MSCLILSHEFLNSDHLFGLRVVCLIAFRQEVSSTGVILLNSQGNYALNHRLFTGVMEMINRIRWYSNLNKNFLMATRIGLPECYATFGIFF